MATTPHHPNLLQRFLDKITVSLTSGCWLWTAATDRDGYGAFWFEGRTRRAHRCGYECVHGVTLHPKAYACHTCDHPGCVNPAHIRIGTARFNSDDKVRKGRQASKLTERDVWQMRRLWFFAGITQAELGKRYGVSAEAARQAVNGKTWAHVPCPRTTAPGWAPVFDASGRIVAGSAAPARSPSSSLSKSAA